MVRKSFAVAARSPFPPHPAHVPCTHSPTLSKCMRTPARSYTSCGPKYKPAHTDAMAGVTTPAYNPATVANSNSVHAAACSMPLAVKNACNSAHPVAACSMPLATTNATCDVQSRHSKHLAVCDSAHPATSRAHSVASCHNSEMAQRKNDGYVTTPSEDPKNMRASCSDAVVHRKLDYGKNTTVITGEMVRQPTLPIMGHHDADARLYFWIKIAIGGLAGCALVLTVAPAALAATGAAKVTTGSSAAFFVKGSAVASSSGTLFALGQSIQNLIPATCALGIGLLSTQAPLPGPEEGTAHAALVIRDHDYLYIDQGEHSAWKNGPRRLSLMHDRDDAVSPTNGSGPQRLSCIRCQCENVVLPTNRSGPRRLSLMHDRDDGASATNRNGPQRPSWIPDRENAVLPTNGNGSRHLSLMHERDDAVSPTNGSGSQHLSCIRCQREKDMCDHRTACECDDTSHTAGVPGGALGSLCRRVAHRVSPQRGALVFAHERDKTAPLSHEGMAWVRTPTRRAPSPVSSATLALFRRK